MVSEDRIFTVEDTDESRVIFVLTVTLETKLGGIRVAVNGSKSCPPALTLEGAAAALPAIGQLVGRANKELMAEDSLSDQLTELIVEAFGAALADDTEGKN